MATWQIVLGLIVGILLYIWIGVEPMKYVAAITYACFMNYRFNKTFKSAYKEGVATYPPHHIAMIWPGCLLLTALISFCYVIYLMMLLIGRYFK